MNRLSRFFHFLPAAAAVRLFSFRGEVQPPRDTGDFAPVLRFAVCSDLHIQTLNDKRIRRLQQLMRTVYAAAATDRRHPRVDAFLFVGDLTNRGTPLQFSLFQSAVTRELHAGTDVLSVVANGHDNWGKGRTGAKPGLDYFQSITGQQPDFHRVIGGFHFLGVSTAPEHGVYYTPAQRDRLALELQKAAEDDPEKPIFVMHHEHVTDTVFGSFPCDGWGNDFFRDVFLRFPQVVHLSGHSHYPLNDPRSVWQGGFTAVGTGALDYAELTVDGERKIHPKNYDCINQGWIVEVDAQNRVRLRGLDFFSGTVLCEETIESPADVTARTFTPAQQKAKAKPPVFPADAALTVRRKDDKLCVTVPAAKSADGFPVFLYRASLLDESGNELGSAWVTDEYWRVHGRENYTVKLEVKPGGKRVSVRAENAYGMASEALWCETEETN